jgi:predicted HicB family RNase H-like nuclease
MPSRHKYPPYRVRLPEAVRERLAARVARTKEPLNKVISDAVREKLDREEQEAGTS